MLDAILGPVSAWVKAQIAAMGYPAIIGMMTISGACIPLPSEIIMPFSGSLVSQGLFNLHLVALCGVLGDVIGSSISYAIGAYGGRGFVERYGKYVLITPHELDRAEKWYARFGDWAVLLSRMTPVVRSFTALPAGISRMRFGRFLLFTAIGALPWCYGLAYLGKVLGDHWEAIRGYFHGADYVIVGVVGVLFVVWVVKHVRALRNNRLETRD